MIIKYLHSIHSFRSGRFFTRILQTALGISLLTTSVTNLQAQCISENEAQETAALFLSKNSSAPMHKSALTCAHTEMAGQEAAFYVFNGDNAYVIVAAERQVVPVLAYSTNGIFNKDEVVPAMKMWMDSYRRQIAALRTAGLPTDRVWVKNEPGGRMESVEPLLESRWNQGMPYNYFCPKDDKGQNERCVTGCVATAMAQLMYYFRWPETGIGSYSYEHETYGQIAADFGNTRYAYAKMCDKPSKINAAASLLTHHCGVAVDMVYGPTASGMYNHKAAYALRTFFKYNPETRYIFRDSNGMAHDSLHPTPYPLDWDSVIIAHLQKGIPLYYAGWSLPWTDGHGFVCDGYQKDSNGNCYYHFNFGWGGSADGYYYTGSLSPMGYNFNVAQELVINAYPDTTVYTYPVPQPKKGECTLTHRSGSLESQEHESDFWWHIRPDLDSAIQINLHLRCQLDTGDAVLITSNNKSFRSIYLQGTDSIFDFSSPICDIDIHWMTTEESHGLGLHASYETDYPEFCTTTRPVTKASATLTDGSGNLHYNNNTCCRTIINVKAYAGVNLSFEYLETEKDRDILRFYDINDNNRLLLELSGKLEGDSNFFLASNAILVEFESDDSLCDEGWSFTYTASKTAVEESSARTWQLFPNPAREQLYIRSEGEALGEIHLIDLCGRCLYRTKCQESETVLDVSQLPKGLYLIRIGNERASYTDKFVKE